MKINSFLVCVLLFGLQVNAQIDNGLSKDTIGICYVPDIKAQFKVTGEDKSIKYFLEHNLRFSTDWLNPSEIIKTKFIIKIQFVICTDGSVCEIKDISNAPESLAKEAKRVIKKSSKKWESALLNGKKVKSFFEQEIIFNSAFK